MHSKGDIFYAWIGLANFLISSVYHFYKEKRLRLLDSIVSNISMAIFVHDSVYLFDENMLLVIINTLSNLLPLIYCFYMSRVYKETYEYLHVGVHWFASMFGIVNHLIIYDFN